MPPPRASERKNKGVPPERYTPSMFRLQQGEKPSSSSVRQPSQVGSIELAQQPAVSDGAVASQTVHSSEKIVDVTGLYANSCAGDIFKTPNAEVKETTLRYSQSEHNLLKPGQKMGVLSFASSVSSKASSRSSIHHKYAEIELQRRLAEIDFENKKMQMQENERRRTEF